MDSVLDVNNGTAYRAGAPEAAKSDELELVVDPKPQVGEVGIAPDCKLLRLHHPRHGWLSFLLPKDKAARLGKALGG